MAGFRSRVFGKFLKRENFHKRQMKKTLPKFGEISINNLHPYMQSCDNGFSISPLMRELMIYAGHLECYSKSEEILEKFTQVKVDISQVYRVTDSAGKSAEEEDKQASRPYPSPVIE
jgi:hypothetical protein